MEVSTVLCFGWTPLPVWRRRALSCHSTGGCSGACHGPSGGNLSAVSSV